VRGAVYFARLTAIAAATALAACNAALAPTSSFGPDRAPSWVSPAAKGAQRLLYVSDLGRWDVYMYLFPSLREIGKLTGFNDPQGVCSDAAGNVWIANAGTDQMLEYAHGTTTLISSLGDPVGVPIGCAIDRSSGNLAVTNLYDFSGSGSVLVYAKASGTPRIYSSSTMYYYYFNAYDARGNLYVSGASVSNTYLLAVLPKGRTSMSLVSIAGGTLYFPGTVAWSASMLVLGDQRCANRSTSCLYQLTVSGTKATIKRTIPLSGSCDVTQAWVGTTQIAGGDNSEYCAGRTNRVEIWPYPAGGKPAKSVYSPLAPVGATLSTAGKS
jgi:hypothetical protein